METSQPDHGPQGSASPCHSIGSLGASSDQHRCPGCLRLLWHCPCTVSDPPELCSGIHRAREPCALCVGTTAPHSNWPG